MLYTRYPRRLAQLSDARVQEVMPDNLIGLEKEGLRVAANGTIASSPHPHGLGAALTHPYITTDFSEALIELVTPALTDRGRLLRLLVDLHAFVYRHLEDEQLWMTSMPCVLEGPSSIPLARYGKSNAAEMKTVYRRGLANRYGRIMQVIAGIHYNFSFADGFWDIYREFEAPNTPHGQFRSESYMALVRNLQRFGWLIPYLFGCSPAVSKTFVNGQSTDLIELDAASYYYPYATSLRLGDIGYQNRQTQGTGMKANYDSLDAYVRSLTWAIETPCPHYEKIGVKVGDRYEQLNANVLQIENEYYSTVRPKQITEWLEKPTLALRRRGVRYIEVRSLDINAYATVGIDEDQLAFMDAFMLLCLLADSPPIVARERRAIDENLALAAHRGREPALTLNRGGRALELRHWALELIERMNEAADLLDDQTRDACRASLARQAEKVRHPDFTPSARFLAEMRDSKETFCAYASRLSRTHRDRLRAHKIDPEFEARLREIALESHERQSEIEAADDIGFDEFLRRYFAQGIRSAEPVPV